jgi:uncharacterized membrane protein
VSTEFKFRSVGKILTAGAANIIYTCPSKYIARMVLLFVTNHGSGNKTVTVKWYDSSANESYFIVGGYVLTAYGYLKLDGSYLVLNPGDTLTVTPEAGSTIDAVVTVEEQYSVSEI